ncbi:MAG: PEP-CTERM sorting domain-containing protein [candidate division Zixibacteria bacterium]|nr:PEP-CTERM sorting domain-containing protein [candidate division Zixibacteria bacterium]
MKLMKLIVATGLMVGLMAGPATAVPSWNYYDFGTFNNTVFDEHNNTADISYPGHGFVPSPGLDDEGGELYDIEGLNFAYENDSIYISLTSTFGPGVNSLFWGTVFATGDLFFGFDGAYDMFAIELNPPSKPTGTNLWEVHAWDYITDKPGTYYNNPAIRFGVGAYQVACGTNLGGVDYMLSLYDQYEPNPMYAGEKDTYVWEFRFAASQLGVNIMDYSTINFHNTMECGNDLLEKEYQIGVVPEPSTMILLGLGLLGVGVYRRRRK